MSRLNMRMPYSPGPFFQPDPALPSSLAEALWRLGHSANWNSLLPNELSTAAPPAAVPSRPTYKSK
jgi:hypothetical protein